MKIEQKLAEMGLKLPGKRKPVGTYLGAVRSGNLVFISGHGPGVEKGDGEFELIRGKVGRDLTADQGYEAAKLVALHLLRALKDCIGDLDKVVRVVKLLGFVNTADGFKDQPRVINGASDLFVALWGEEGRHARSAVGMYELPMGIAVEVEAVVEVRD
ncbi:MAG: RidA family protein [Candidatus Binataceae bacterium]|nr:RidA family protein [Candidatus Binataceae bacterium]